MLEPPDDFSPDFLKVHGDSNTLDAADAACAQGTSDLKGFAERRSKAVMDPERHGELNDRFQGQPPGNPLPLPANTLN
jgi:hypothetical protein